MKAVAVVAAAAVLIPPAVLASARTDPSPAPRPVGGLTATAVPARAGAMPAVLTLRGTFELQCGRPRGDSVGVVLPSALRLTRPMAGGSVLVDGRPASSVRVRESVVTLGLTRAGGAICDVIGPGTITVVFTRAARVGNPSRAGSYGVTMENGGLTARGRLDVTP